MAANKRLLTPKDQRNRHPTGCLMETFAVVNPLNTYKKSVHCYLCGTFSFKF